MIIGHQAIRKIFSKLHQENKLPHAMMLAGTAGIGKRLVANEIAQSLICINKVYGGCGECTNCLPFLAGNYPDFHQLDCQEKEQVSAESIRQIINLLSLKAFGGQARVLIFDNAESLSITSSNILLKSLEEPRPNTYYILISANPSFIPVTIRSRSQTYYLADLSTSEISEIINSGSLNIDIPSEINLTNILPYASGSLKSIRQILTKPDLWKMTKTFLTDLFAGKVQALTEIIKPLTKEREDLIDFLFFTELILRQQMLLPKGPEQQHKIAILLNNILLTKYYITQRNLHAVSLLSAIFADSSMDLEHSNLDEYLIP